MIQSFRRKIVTSPVFHEAVGIMAASCLGLVLCTNRAAEQSANIYKQVEIPLILALWNGQHFMSPFIKRAHDPRHRGKVLSSRHRDGEINARAAKPLNIGTIRG